MKSDFVKCGILGWCIEIIWTAFRGIKSKNNKFIGYTSIIMFPIYGLASVIKPISLKLKKMKMPTIIRGIVYSIGIFMGRESSRFAAAAGDFPYAADIAH